MSLYLVQVKFHPSYIENKLDLILYNRKEDAPRSFKEICSVSNVKKEEIGRCFKMTLKTIDTFNDIKATDEFTSRFGPILGMNSLITIYTYIG